mmetsp:Transcript_26649/g.42222  ORF Transcript_26649/g.42222 Transcript_26649/m.42222 type:complete len:220 (-) Transcript_26649:83-742(-)
MSLQLVQYSDSEEDTEQDLPPTVSSGNEQQNDKKRKRSHIDTEFKEEAQFSSHLHTDPDHEAQHDDNDDGSRGDGYDHNVNEPARKRQRTETKRAKKKKIKLNSINIKDKLSSGITDKVDFLQPAKQQHTEFVLENVMEHQLTKIEETNQERQKRIAYERRLKKLEINKARQEEGLKRKKEHKKYLKHAMQEHIDEYGEKAKAKGVGKGGHTKNQRVSW